MNRSSDLIVLAADREELPAWLGTLQDWSALGLVRDFVAISLDEVADRTWRAVLVTDGAALPVGFHDELAVRTEVTSVSVFSLGRVSTTATLPDVETSRQLRDEVRQSLAQIPFTWGQVLTVGVPQTWPQVESAATAWTGGHTVVLAPEHAHSPATGKAIVTAGDLMQPLGLTHGAAGLASVVGLWTGARQGVVRGEPSAGGGRVVLVRTFLRHISTAGTTNELLGRVIDVSSRYPVPAAGSDRQLQRVSDEAGAASAMAEALLQRHEAKLRRGERAVSTVGRVRIPLSEMLRRFFQFLGAALRRAPQTFAEALETEVARVTAPLLQRAMLGDNSAFHITVRDVTGVSADGEILPTTTLELQLDERIASLSGDERTGGAPRHDVPDLWKDYIDGALTLLDGHERSRHLPTPDEAGSVGVVTNPRRVVPDLGTVLSLPPEVQRHVAADELPPNDFERMAIVGRTLEDLESSQGESVPILTHLLSRIEQWRDAASDSYTGRLGRHVSDEISTLRDEVLALQDAVRKHARGHGVDEAIRRDQMTLGRLTWIFLLVALAATGGLFWLASGESLPWLDAVGWVVGVWVVSFAAFLTIFIVRQRRLFMLLNERRRARAQAEVDHQNLTAALKDLRRLLAVHRQYLDWSTVLAHFLRAPWGDVTEDAGRTTQLGIGFGWNQRFGRLVEDEVAATEMARQAQTAIMEPGWLSTAWQEFMIDLPNFPDRHRMASDSKLVFSDARMGERPILNVWREAVVSTRRMDVAGPILERVHAYIDSLPRDVRRHVRWTDGMGIDHEDSYVDFVAGVTETTGTGGEFSRAVLSQTPSSTDSAVVGQSEMQDLTAGDGPLVLTQVSEPFPAGDLAFCRGSAPERSEQKWRGEAPQV